jgi:NADPH:quinone reductase-like Zn-dependent oxidoreductase
MSVTPSGMMKAVRLHQFGKPNVLVFEDVSRPETQEGQVLVHVHAAGVGSWDGEIRRGEWKSIIDYPFPLILGTDLSGTVEAVGAGVKHLQVGQEVYGIADMTLSGSNAEYALCEAKFLAAKPKSLNHMQAASMPVVAATAWQMLFDIANLMQGQSVLIHGAAGSVGQFAVQFAKHKGIHTIANASGRDADYLQSLGADEFIDYHSTPFEKVVHDVDAVIDTIGGETRTRSWSVIKKDGILVASSAPPTAADEAAAAIQGVRTSFVYGTAHAELLSQIGCMIDASEVKPDVGTVLPLLDVQKAHEMIDSGHHPRGKIVLQVIQNLF